MTGIYELHEALLRVERAAREYIDAERPQTAVRYNLLRSALQDLDDVRASVDAEQKAGRV